MIKTLKFATISLIINVIFSAYHITFGVLTHSWWLLTIGFYYTILCIIRFAVFLSKEQNCFLIRFTGIMLMFLSLPLVSTVTLSVIQDRGTVFHQITMITIALYAFTKITIAAINLIKSRKNRSPKIITLRNLSFADGFVSIFSLQRSMLVSFEGMSKTEIQIMNLATGSAVYIIVFLLGLNLVKSKSNVL